jgi:hypothetical protein
LCPFLAATVTQTVKDRIEENVGTPADLQRLVFKGKVLFEDDRTLFDFGIREDGARVHLLLLPRHTPKPAWLTEPPLPLGSLIPGAFPRELPVGARRLFKVGPHSGGQEVGLR